MATPDYTKSDIVDVMIDLPKEFAHLCSAEDDEGKLHKGKIRFLLNAQAMQLYREISDDLEISRALPVEVTSVNISDPVVVWLIQETSKSDNEYEPMSAAIARQTAMGWYRQQKRQASADAFFVALSMYNELNIAPVPYEEGETAFSFVMTEEQAAEQSQRRLPKWVREAGKIQIPPPERSIMTDLYERRLKQLFDMTKYCGREYLLIFHAQFEEGMAKAMRYAPQDADGFPATPARGKVSKKSSSSRKDEGTGSGADDDHSEDGTDN